MKKIKEIMQFFECFLLNVMKNEEKMQFFECFLLNAIKNKGNTWNNAIFLMFLVECDEN
jgi:hypothetical protein